MPEVYQLQLDLVVLKTMEIHQTLVLIFLMVEVQVEHILIDQEIREEVVVVAQLI